MALVSTTLDVAASPTGPATFLAFPVAIPHHGLVLGHRWSSLVGTDAAVAIDLEGMADLVGGRTGATAASEFYVAADVGEHHIVRHGLTVEERTPP